MSKIKSLLNFDGNNELRHFRIFAWFNRDMKIYMRLLVSFLLLSLISVSVTGLLVYYKSSFSIESKIKTYSLQIVNEINKNIKTKMDRLSSATDEVYLSNTIQDCLDNYYNSVTDIDKAVYESDIIQYLKRKFSIDRDIIDVEIINNRNERLIGVSKPISEGNYDNSLNLDAERLSQTASMYDGQVFWTTSSYKPLQKSVFLIRTINSVASYKLIGTLVILVDSNIFSDSFKDVDIGKDSDIFIIDSKNNVVASRSSALAPGSVYSAQNLSAEIAKNAESGNTTFTTYIDEKRYLLAFAPIKNSDWYIVGLIPFSYLNSEAADIGFYIVTISLIIFMFSLLISLAISRGISNPLKKLVKSMDKVKTGDFSIDLLVERKDEIGELAENFKSMLAEISNLMQNIRQKEKQKRVMELKALQAQINPHFISNTLNTVKWLANIQQADNINELVTSLIQLLQVSSGKGNELIIIREEIEYLRNYITIQEYRCCEKFRVNFEVEDSVWDYKILAFLLQPIVENSIIHGIEPMKGQGYIIIKVFADSDKLQITVMDNGVGLSDEQCQKILTEESKEESKRFSGIGLKNVNDRIKLYYGDEFGIKIESVKNMYTSIGITIPIISGWDDEIR